MEKSRSFAAGNKAIYKVENLLSRFLLKWLKRSYVIKVTILLRSICLDTDVIRVQEKTV